jgi:hypothetical protein
VHRTARDGQRSRHTQLGATLVYLSPGATFNVTQRTSVYLFGQVPVYQRVNGYQLEPRWSVSAGVHAAF